MISTLKAKLIYSSLRDAPKELYLEKEFYLNILMYADDPVIIQENENDLQRSLYYLTNILTDATDTFYYV